MNQPRIAIIGLLASFVVTASAFTTIAQAQAATPAPTHIAVIDFLKAYKAMKETKDSNDQLIGLQGELKTMAASHKAQLDDLQSQMTNAVKGDSPKHQELMEEFDKKSLQFDMEEKAIQIRAARQHGRQLKQAFDEISVAVAKIAKDRGYDAVMVNNGQDLPDTVGDMANQQQLESLIFNRSFLYVSPKVDITDDVVAAVDAAAAKPATPAPGH